MRIALLANEKAGGDAGPEEIAGLLRRHGAEVVPADAPADRLAAAGGDGTLAPAAVRAAKAGVPLAVLPAGTANDFARALDIPLDLDAAAALAADPDADVHRIELGRLDGRPFLNVVNAGLAVPAAERAGSWKKRLGPLAYGLGAMVSALREQPVPVRVRVDGEEVFAGRAWQVVVAVTGAFGGGSRVAEATPRDGRLDVLVVPAGSRLGLLPVALRLKRGRPAGGETWRGREVELDGPEKLNVDGELLDVSGPVRATCEAAAVSVMVPRAMATKE
jgi:diacylglycerol kinase (ATP)